MSAQAGVRALGISLDGADAATHDAFRGWEGSFQRTLRMLADARELGLAVQVNTTITRRNVGQVDRMAELLAGQGIAMWSVFFLVPVGRGVEEERIRPEEYEVVFEQLWRHARRQPYAVKTTEAPHYRRFVLQHGGDPLAGPAAAAGSGHRPSRPAGRGRRQGRDVRQPHRRDLSRRLPAAVLRPFSRRFGRRGLSEPSDVSALRDPDHFKGKCGICEYRASAAAAGRGPMP